MSSQATPNSLGQPPEEPEHRGERRRFLVWALMLGAVKPEAVVQRIVADVEETVAEELRA